MPGFGGIGSWIIDNVPSGPRCVVLPDPDSGDAPNDKCNNICGTYTVLDYPICDACHAAVSL